MICPVTVTVCLWLRLDRVLADSSGLVGTTENKTELVPLECRAFAGCHLSKKRHAWCWLLFPKHCLDDLFDQMFGALRNIRGQRRPDAKGEHAKENPYAVVAEFPQEKLFDGELKLLLMDGSVEYSSSRNH